MKLLPLSQRTAVRATRKSDNARTPNTLARHLFTGYPEYRVEHLKPQNCKHGIIVPELYALMKESGLHFAVEQLGTSLEGRSINIISCGKGMTRIFLWSQMHGDESTATLALMDIFNFLIKTADREKWIREMLDQVTLHFLPMLNPDGAERVQRRTAQTIDMNRDAQSLATPEAKILRSTQQKLKPHFGFNLHDQDPASVGDSREIAAIAFLAPAPDMKKSMPMGRIRAVRVAALMTRALSQFIPKNISRYPDDFEPRAFGDTFQASGTSTVLIESGHAMKDPNKDFVRKLNFVSILTALRCIGNGSYQDAELDLYHRLPENSKNVFDYLIRGVLLEHERWSHPVDIGLMLNRQQSNASSTTMVTIKDMGDLSTFIGLETIDASSRRVPSSFIQLEQNLPLSTILDALQLPHR